MLLPESRSQVASEIGSYISEYNKLPATSTGGRALLQGGSSGVQLPVSGGGGVRGGSSGR